MKKICGLITLVIMVNIFATSCRVLFNRESNENSEINYSLYSTENIIDSGPKKGGILRLFTTEPDTFNPLLTKNKYVKDFLSTIYEGLVKIGKDQKPVAALSDYWRASDDGLAWDFHIRDGVMWHDGTPLTVQDVEFTFDFLMRNDINSIYKNNIQNIITYAAVTGNTFRIILKKPYAFTPEQMTFPIIQKNYFLKNGLIQSVEEQKPVGTGPYIFDSYIKGNTIDLKLHDKWWNADREKDMLPYIENISVSIYDNAKDEASAFQTRESDVMCIESADYIKFSGRADLRIKEYAGSSFEFIAFNLYREPFSERTVRQSIAYSINRNEIVDEILPGNAVISELPIIPDSWIYDSSVKSYEFDMDKSAELLESHGWKLDNGKLHRWVAGIDTFFEINLLINTGNETRKKVAGKISDQLKEAGIKVTIVEKEWNEFIKAMKSGDFDMALLGCTLPVMPDISFMYSTPYLISYNSIQEDQMVNITGYNSAEVNSCLDRLNRQKNHEEMKKVFADLKSAIDNDVPFIGLYCNNYALLCSRRVRGSVDPCVTDKFNGFCGWYLREE